LGDKRAEVLRLLNVLRGYYSLRDLQDLLGVPYQTLWKYVNLLSVPEERTCEKILARIAELNLLDRLIKEEVSRAQEGILHLTHSPGFLHLFSLTARSFLKGSKATLVIPLSEAGTTLAVAVAVELNIVVCPVMSNPPLDRRGYYLISYGAGDHLMMLALPKSCVKEKARALLVDAEIRNYEKVEVFTYILRHARAVLQGVMAIKMSKEVREKLEEAGIKHYSLA